MTYKFSIPHWLEVLPLKLTRFAYNRISRRTDPLIVAAAERVLSTTVGSPIQFTQVERLSKEGRRNLLLRCYSPSDSGLPPSLIIKKVEATPYSPGDTSSWDTMRFFNDWMGSQFLSTIPSKFKHSPHFYGGDRNLGFIILEDVQHCSSLVEPLLGNERSRAEEALLKYATCLGQLHTDTMGKVAEFDELFRTISPIVKSTRATVNIHKLQFLLEKLGIHPTSNWLQDLETIDYAVNHPNAFLTYIHADACPDNVLYADEQLRLIDFETGHFGHALIDIACSRMMFPSCWCANRLPQVMVQQMENIYRATLSPNCPLMEDERIFETALVNVCGFWLLDTLMRHGGLEYALQKDFHWGISTMRQRILARLEAFIATSQEFNQLSSLCGTFSHLLDTLRQRWLDVPCLPLYPAFQNG